MTSKFTMQQFFFTLASLSLVVFILGAGRAFFVPLLAAIVVTYLIIQLKRTFDHYFKPFNLPSFVISGFAILTCLLGISAVWIIVDSNLEALNEKIPNYQAKLIRMTESFLAVYSPESSGEGARFLRENVFGTIQPRAVVSDVARTLGGLASQVGLVIIYTLFLLMEHKNINKKLRRVFTKKGDYAKAQSVLSNISHDLNSYFKIKAIASWATGLLAYVVLLAFGVDFAAFWALLIFMLNFIPTVGSLLATVFPITIALIQFEGGISFVIVAVLLIGIQVLVGSILEPRYQGNTLNISPLIIVLSLVFWGSVWGVVGALLSIPIMAMLNIVCSKFESTQWISALVSADGKGKGNFKSPIKLKWRPKRSG